MRDSSGVEGLRSVSCEFGRVELDARLQARIRVTVESLSRAPDVGFPQALGTVAKQEGFYRLLNNPRVRYGVLVEAHARETVNRMAPGTTARIVYDTSEFSFCGEVEREGLGRARKEAKNAFFGHLALAICGDASRRPLGVLGMKCWARAPKSRGNRKLSGGDLAKLKNKESERWVELVEAVEARVGDRCSALNVFDREGDSYTIFDALTKRGSRFVVRMARDRVVVSVDHDEGDDESLSLSHVLNDMPKIASRTVSLGKRVAKPAPGAAKNHPARMERIAELSLHAGKVVLKRPRYLDDEHSDTLELNVVYVKEATPPLGAEPVTWVLLTTEPISTPTDVEAIVDHYRCRWMIEELFKALKTGCAFEKRQLESFASLTNALALLIPIAWQMLLLRSLARDAPDAPAETALSPTVIRVLQHYQKRLMPKSNPTVIQAYLAIAGHGGYMTHNGPPGWRLLWAGMQEILKLADAWDAGKMASRCDQ